VPVSSNGVAYECHQRLRASFEILTLRLTLRFGIMWAVAIWFLVITLKRA